MEKKDHNSIEMKRLAKKIEFLDNPERRGDILPEKLLNMLPVKKAGNFLDLGAGTGYITIPAAKIVEGMVFGLDIDSNMLEVINSKAKKENITNVKALKGSIDDIPLSDNSIDFALASLVLHEVKKLSNSLQQIKQVLKPDGYFVCIEIEKKDNPTHSHPRIASSIMEQEITNAGLRVTEKLYPTGGIYIIIAKKQ
ncbi:class I SAM-dependent methyltransferase [Virgibacillus necropolis]|uniref:class I SAM-dependent methyltransferase n=1 Tax=Virgibacillus necropolis TaxID=163877 RepID=UPI00384E9A01